jgi:2-dehydropantoate 2-reductase
MKYLIVGGGAMGSVLAAEMTRAGQDVTLITRGTHLEAIRSKGHLSLHYAPEAVTYDVRVKAVAEDEYHDSPDVVILAVKAYSLDSIYPLLDRICRPDTVVLPLLNALNAGPEVAAGMRSAAVIAQGVAYVACEFVEPGACKNKMDFFEIVFGARPGGESLDPGVAATIKKDLESAGCTAEISDNMLRAAIQKFARVSAASGAMVYFGATNGAVIGDDEKRAFLIQLCEELVALAEAAGCPLPSDFDAVEHLLAVAKTVGPEYKTSLMYDFLSGKQTEYKTMFLEPYLLGRQHGLEMAGYRKVCNLFEEVG